MSSEAVISILKVQQLYVFLMYIESDYKSKLKLIWISLWPLKIDVILISYPLKH